MKYAANGVFQFFKIETHAKIHLFFTILVVIAGVLLSVDTVDWIFLSLAIGFVIVSEMLNTAVEKIVDVTSPKYNKTAGLIKDISAGAVLVAVIISVLIGCLVFLKYI